MIKTISLAMLAMSTIAAPADELVSSLPDLDIDFNIYSGYADIIGNFEITTLGGLISPSVVELEALFRTYPFGGILIYNAEAHADAQFDIIITNRLFWEPIDASVPAESWIQIVPTSSNWVKIAATNPGVWTKKTV